MAGNLSGCSRANGGTALLLAETVSLEQLAAVGDQAGGRVFQLLPTDNFWGDYHHMQSQGVRVTEMPREEL